MFRQNAVLRGSGFVSVAANAAASCTAAAPCLGRRAGSRIVRGRVRAGAAARCRLRGRSRQSLLPLLLLLLLLLPLSEQPESLLPPPLSPLLLSLQPDAVSLRRGSLSPVSAMALCR